MICPLKCVHFIEHSVQLNEDFIHLNELFIQKHVPCNQFDSVHDCEMNNLRRLIENLDLSLILISDPSDTFDPMDTSDSKDSLEAMDTSGPTDTYNEMDISDPIDTINNMDTSDNNLGTMCQ